jgi:glycosyltransferase EpsD
VKILYVTTVSNTVNSFLIPHIKLLIEHGHQVDVAFNILQTVKPEIKRLGCKINHIPFQRSPLKSDNLKAYKQLKKVVQEEGYDLIHTHTPIASFITRMACRGIPNVKVIYTAHGFHFFEGAPLQNWLLYYPMEKISAKYTDAIITINEEDFESAKKLKSHTANSVFRIHGVGVNLNMFSVEKIDNKDKLRERLGYKSDDFILFFAAELNENKHQDFLIEVIKVLKNRIPNMKLLLAGEGNAKEQYIQLAKESGVENHVEFLGYRNDIKDLLEISDVAVSSSRREGLPVNIMESMAMGLPLVVTDCRGNRDLVVDQENGFVIKHDDTEGFANSIQNLFHHEELRMRFSKKSRELIQKYSLDNVTSELKNIYENFQVVKS